MAKETFSSLIDLFKTTSSSSVQTLVCDVCGNKLSVFRKKVSIISIFCPLLSGMAIVSHSYWCVWILWSKTVWHLLSFLFQKPCVECKRLFCSQCLQRCRDRALRCKNCCILTMRPPLRSALLDLRVKDLQHYLNQHNVSTRGCLGWNLKLPCWLLLCLAQTVAENLMASFAFWFQRKRI